MITRNSVPSVPAPRGVEATDALPPAALAEVYARQVDDLAALVEAERARRDTPTLRVVDAALGELHVALDEMAARVTDLQNALDHVYLFRGDDQR